MNSNDRDRTTRNRPSRRRRPFRTNRPIQLFVACMTLSMALIGAVAVAAVLHV